MRSYFIFFILIFLLNCSFNDSKQGVTNTNVVQNEINDPEEYSFEKYVNSLLNKNKFKEFPDINNIPE